MTGLAVLLIIVLATNSVWACCMWQDCDSRDQAGGSLTVIRELTK